MVSSGASTAFIMRRADTNKVHLVSDKRTPGPRLQVLFYSSVCTTVLSISTGVSRGPLSLAGTCGIIPCAHGVTWNLCLMP
jgi:hypothetical protein